MTQEEQRKYWRESAKRRRDEKKKNPEKYKEYFERKRNDTRRRMQEWRKKNPEKNIERLRISRNTGDLLDDSQILFYGYKEPLRKFEEGFGYKGVLCYSKEKDKVQCHICGRFFRYINNAHLQFHGLTTREYKIKVGLAKGTALIGEGTREKFIQKGYNPDISKYKKGSKLLIEREKNREKNRNKTKYSLEFFNKRGTCPDQLLDKIDKTIKSYGRVCSYQEFLKMNGGRFGGSIQRTFGGWGKALTQLGFRSIAGKYSNEYLLESLKNFYNQNNRSPVWSDFQRGLLPPYLVYYKRFNNLNVARILANIPIIIQLSNGKKEEFFPTEEQKVAILKQYNY